MKYNTGRKHTMAWNRTQLMNIKKDETHYVLGMLCTSYTLFTLSSYVFHIQYTYKGLSHN